MFHNSTSPKKRHRSTQNNRTKQVTSAVAAATASPETATNTTVGATAAAPETNERLLRDKHDAARKQHQLQQQQQLRQQRTITPQESSATFCNSTAAITAFVDCCRDVNCRLNSLRAPTPSSASTSTNASMENGYICDENYEFFREQRRSVSLRSSMEKSIPLSSASLSTSTESAGPVSARTTPQLSATTTTKQTSAASSLITRSWLNSFDSIDELARNLLNSKFTINFNLDLFSWLLFFLAFCTRFYRLTTPAHIVFDELHYGKYVSHYMRNVFFFDQHPPLGKQLVAVVASFAGGFDGNSTFTHIGAAYGRNVPIFWLRFLPALCGSLLPTIVYKLQLQAGLNRWTALLGGLLVVFDNALLTQSRFVLMESMLLLFATAGLYALLHFQRCRFASIPWLFAGLTAAILLTCATSVKYAGFFTFCLAAYLMCRYLWDLLYDSRVTDLQLLIHTVARMVIFTIVPLAIYLAIFYVHLKTLNHAGPHDSAMTSAFQASLEGGLASITRNQPLKVVHGSQITLRHTHGRTCWLHSHNHVYPVRYPDKRGSSHQQQVTCYSFKDVNNWWIVKRPERDDLVVGDEPDVIYDGDIIQLVHGITSRALNSHDVAAPLTPQCQEVSCYIDYNIKMSAEMLWRVEILNKDTEGPVWHAIKSEIRLIHTTTGAALRFSGRQLPDWGFNQHEVVADRVVENKDAIWNVEEHRYTKTHDERERERQLLSAEMLPTKKTKLSFWEKFIELQTKMLWNSKQIQSHMYSSEPLEWPLLDKGIAYWIDTKSNGQIHLLGNVLTWYTASVAVVLYVAFGVFYLLRRRRLCYDLEETEWKRFLEIGDIYFIGYLMHYLPYFLMDRTLFLHNYLPALVFKMQLLCYVIEHVDYVLRRFGYHFVVRLYRLAIVVWLAAVLWVFWQFLPLSYGIQKLSADEVIELRWKDTWDFILQKEYNLSDKSTDAN